MMLYDRLRMRLPDSWAQYPEAIMAVVDSIATGKALDGCLASRGMLACLTRGELATLKGVAKRISGQDRKGSDEGV